MNGRSFLCFKTEQTHRLNHKKPCSDRSSSHWGWDDTFWVEWFLSMYRLFSIRHFSSIVLLVELNLHSLDPLSLYFVRSCQSFPVALSPFLSKMLVSPDFLTFFALLPSRFSSFYPLFPGFLTGFYQNFTFSLFFPILFLFSLLFLIFSLFSWFLSLFVKLLFFLRSFASSLHSFLSFFHFFCLCNFYLDLSSHFCLLLLTISVSHAPSSLRLLFIPSSTVSLFPQVLPYSLRVKSAHFLVCTLRAIRFVHV